MQKLHIKLFALLLAAFLIISGCSASTSPAGTTTTEGSMVAIVNGNSWSSAVIPPGITGGATAKMNSNGSLAITGVASDLSSIVLVLLHSHVGLDTLGLGNTGSFIDEDKHVFITAGSGAGTVNITTLDLTHQ